MGTASRPLIASVDRALAIVERVAAKHGLTAAGLVATRYSRAVVLARGEVMHTLNAELGWTYQRAAELTGLSVSRLHSAVSEWKGVQANIERYLPDTVADLRAQLYAAEAARQDAERRLAAMLGTESVDLFVSELQLVPRAAIVLTALAEAYPKHARDEHILNFYDAACVRMNYGLRNGATKELMWKNIEALRRSFAERGWPNPVSVGPMINTRVLSHAAAVVLHERVGVPSKTQIANCPQGLAA